MLTRPTGGRARLLLAASLLLLAGGAAFVALLARRAPRADAASPVQFQPGARLGGAEGSDDAFGLVGDVAADGDGRIFVLDVLLNRVSVFSPEGKKLGTFGRPGAGPGELAVPAALAVDARGRVYVLDRANARIGVYEAAGDGFTAVSPLPLDFNAEDLCLADGRLYVLGEREGRVIHELSTSTGAVVRSFAPDAAARDPLMRSLRSSGYLGCANGRGELVFLPMLLSEARRYDTRSGALVRTDTIPGYRPVQVRREGRGVIFEGPKDGPHHMAAGVIPMPEDRWLVQTAFAREGARSQHELESVRSYLLSPGGSAREVPGEHPRLVSALGRRAFHTATEPHPMVEVIDLRPERGARP